MVCLILWILHQKSQIRDGEMQLIDDEKCKIAPPRHDHSDMKEKKKLKKMDQKRSGEKSLMSPKVDSCRKL